MMYITLTCRLQAGKDLNDRERNCRSTLVFVLLFSLTIAVAFSALPVYAKKAKSSQETPCVSAAQPDPLKLIDQHVAGLQPLADGWRQSGSRVDLPDKADRERVLAEASYQEKEVQAAIGHYKAALAIYPTWPQGQFNLAVLCGESREYDCALEHMREYLLLSPDAPDAKSAKEKVIIWEDKLQASLPHGPLDGIEVRDWQESSKRGVSVTGVAAGSKADSLGLKPNDVIFKINRQKIASVSDFSQTQCEVENQSNVVFEVYQGGDVHRSVVLADSLTPDQQSAHRHSPNR